MKLNQGYIDKYYETIKCIVYTKYSPALLLKGISKMININIYEQMQ